MTHEQQVVRLWSIIGVFAFLALIVTVLTWETPYRPAIDPGDDYSCTAVRCF